MANYLDLEGLTAYDTKIKEYIATMMADGVTKMVVSELPLVANARSNVIYLIPAADTADNNIKDEYILIDGAFERIGSTAVDLDGYVNEVNYGVSYTAIPTSGFSLMQAASIDGNVLTFNRFFVEKISSDDVNSLFAIND